jgi:aspartate/methionine/tyrosine aminotransferase
MRLLPQLEAMQPTLIRQLHEAKPPGAIDLGMGQPKLAPPPLLVAAMQAASSNWAAYSSNVGLRELRERIAEANDAHPDEVIVCAGSAQALFMLISSMLAPGDELLVPDPGYPVYPRIAQFCGATPVPYPLAAPGFGLDVDALLAKLSPKTRLVVLNNPSNPTSSIASAQSLAALCTALAERGVPYLSDEVYASLDYRSPGAPSVRLRAYSHEGFTVDSLSKSHALMGWRLGWLIGPRKLCQQLVVVQQMMLSCAPVPAQHAAVHAFSPEGLQAAALIRQTLAARRAIALEGLRSCPVPMPTCEGGLYCFIDVRHLSNGDDKRLAFSLLEHGVVLIPGSAFGENGRGHLRLSFGAKEEDLREGITRLRQGLEAISC